LIAAAIWSFPLHSHKRLPVNITGQLIGTAGVFRAVCRKLCKLPVYPQLNCGRSEFTHNPAYRLWRLNCVLPLRFLTPDALSFTRFEVLLAR